MTPNEGKQLEIQTMYGSYLRIPIKTHVVTLNEDPFEILRTYAIPKTKTGDVIAISEKVIAICQGRSYPIKDIYPGKLANFLVKYVHKSKYGIGLGSGWTMQLAIQEAGALRILFAAFCAAMTKPFGIKGVFYHIAGRTVASIDGPTPYTLPPYNEYAKLGPKKPHELARQLSEQFSLPVFIIDANDLGVEVLGASDKKLIPVIKAVFKDNPLGQTSEQTPIAIVRKI